MMSTSQGRSRWAGLPAAERDRREAQSGADQDRAATGNLGQIAPGERERRARQSHADRELAEIQDAIHETVYGGDVNMMSKGDW